MTKSKSKSKPKPRAQKPSKELDDKELEHVSGGGGIVPERVGATSTSPATMKEWTWNDGGLTVSALTKTGIKQ
jgi:bacteriocin-like protein